MFEIPEDEIKNVEPVNDEPFSVTCFYEIPQKPFKDEMLKAATLAATTVLVTVVAGKVIKEVGSKVKEYNARKTVINQMAKNVRDSIRE